MTIVRQGMPSAKPWCTVPEVDTGTRWVVTQAVVLVLIGLSIPFFGGGPLLATTILAVVLFVAGQGMALSAALKMRQYLTAHPAPAAGASLLQGGVYNLVRHPMYGGVLLMGAAVAVFDRNVVAALLTGLLLAVFQGKTRYEETLLADAFLGYDDYRKRVTRRFIPWVL